ncbi:Aldo-keto reductase [Fasciola hepatica]|uniref:Aldo-keto reductase n=1 Tax=Fasciola hepatica TaxID=6192 RepID=A0A4E0R8Y2_FASHE|nr:Aldo-keto reductase [Fasciola hepatica]
MNCSSTHTTHDEMETVEFSNGQKMPVLGLGTWTSPSDKVKAAVLSALEAGYRHIDGAFVYGNEQAVGEALKDGMKRLNLRREDVFITSKVWCTYFRPELVRKCCETTLKDLQLSYVDLYLIHWPVALKPGDINFPKSGDGETLELDHPPLAETWKAMEKLVDDKLVRSIGISNFNKRQIDMILGMCRIKPVNLQVEIHANFPNTKLVEYAQSKGLTVTAYAPLGSPGASPGEVDLLTAPWVCEIADRHQRTTSQILLRYLLQRNIVVIPKSVTPSRIVENSKIFDFKLSDEEMRLLNTRGVNKRQFVLASMRLHPEYPFKDEF